MKSKKDKATYMKLRKHNGGIVCVNSNKIKNIKLGSTKAVHIVLKSHRVIIGEIL